jgi:hypothetical protein
MVPEEGPSVVPCNRPAMSGDEICLPAVGLVSWGRRGDRAGQPDQLLCKHDDSTLDPPITVARLNRGFGVRASESREWSRLTGRASTRGAGPVDPRATSRMGESDFGSPRRPGYRCLRLLLRFRPPLAARHRR